MYWYQENGTSWIAYNDENQPCYLVDFDKEGNGYYWEDSHGYGFGLFDTVELAKKDCETSNFLHFAPKDKELTADEVVEILGDRRTQEVIEARLFGD